MPVRVKKTRQTRDWSVGFVDSIRTDVLQFDQLRTVMQEMSLRFSVRHAASA